MSKDKKLLNIIKRRRIVKLGHKRRNVETYQLAHLVFQGKTEELRSRGPDQISWLKDIRDRIGLDSASLFKATWDRDLYERITVNF